jgi:hypothetical protein
MKRSCHNKGGDFFNSTLTGRTSPRREIHCVLPSQDDDVIVLYGFGAPRE